MGYLNETGLARFYAGLKTKFAGKSAATASAAGLMSAADKGKLDGIEAGAKLAPRPNLLDNWYFGNPVNQRGQTEYTAAGYSIDRWYNRSNALKINLASEGLKITLVNDAYRQFSQRIETPSKLLGQKLTISMLLNTLSGISASDISIRLYSSDAVGSNTTVLLDTDSRMSSGGTILCTGTATISNTISHSGINATIQVAASAPVGAYFNVAGVKLELGDTQTLARQVNGAWVLNELPNYGEQLARCQRYLLKLEYATRYRMCEIRDHSLAFFIPTPVTMREKPALHIGNGSIDVRNPNSAYIAGFTVYAESLSQNGVMIHASKTNHGVSDAVLVSAGHDNYLIAEL